MAEQGKGTYRLVPSELPQRRRSSRYAEIIREFRAGDAESVLIAETGRKPLTLWQGLRKALQVEGIEDVRVVQRGEETYLVRTRIPSSQA